MSIDKLCVLAERKSKSNNYTQKGVYNKWMITLS